MTGFPHPPDHPLNFKLTLFVFPATGHRSPATLFAFLVTGHRPPATPFVFLTTDH